MLRRKIVVVTPEFPSREEPYRGRPIYQMLQCLQEHADIRVLCPWARYPDWLRPVHFEHHKPSPEDCSRELRAHYFGYPAIPGFTRPVNGIMCGRYLMPFVRELQPNAVLNFWLYPEGYAAVAVGRKLGIPVIVGSIGTDLNRIADPMTNWLTRSTLQRASFVITKSRHLRYRALEMGVKPERARTVLNGCNTKLFHPRDRMTARQELGVARNAELVAFVGRIETTKGIRELFEAIAILSRSRPELCAAYIGDGPGLAPLQEQASLGNLRGRFIFAHSCSPDRVAQWLAAANLLALPSYAEGCPNVIIEALSCGRPVVATDVGGIPELVDARCGVLVRPHDVNDLVKGIDTLLDTTWDEGEICRRFRRSWDQVAQEVFDVCEAVIDNAQGRRTLEQEARVDGR